MDEFHARRLVDLYADTILRISYSYLKQTCDAEDICQTVFLKYLTNDCTFDSIDHEKAWIIRTTINAVSYTHLDVYKRQDLHTVTICPPIFKISSHFLALFHIVFLRDQWYHRNNIHLSPQHGRCIKGERL